MDDFQFNAVLLEISSELSAEQLEGMKYLCPDIGKRQLEKIDSGQKLFQTLTERRQLGADNTDFVCKLLTKIQRPDLAEKLENYERQCVSPEKQPPKEERDKLDIATEVLTELLGRNWRKLGRKLGLSEVKLDSISQRHSRDLEELTVELMKEWIKNQGAKARVEELIKALRDCQFNMMADKVEKKLRERENGQKE